MPLRNRIRFASVFPLDRATPFGPSGRLPMSPKVNETMFQFRRSPSPRCVNLMYEPHAVPSLSSAETCVCFIYASSSHNAKVHNLIRLFYILFSMLSHSAASADSTSLRVTPEAARGCVFAVFAVFPVRLVCNAHQTFSPAALSVPSHVHMSILSPKLNDYCVYLVSCE